MRISIVKSLFLSGAAAGAMTGAALAQSEAVDEIIVVGDGSQIQLTDPYAGGQVARGGRAGLLGNLDFLDAPFSGTAFTQELIEAQQSESIGDVLQNDPVVRVAKGFGNFQEVYVVRGFPVFSDDMTLNGLYGILPRQFVAAELFERVEVFRGANAFVNGAAPGGSSVGGAINLVPKRAPEDGVKRLTLGYENAGQFYGAADLGTRLGQDGEWGVRFNAVYRNGESSVEDQDRDLKVFSLGTDYSGDYFRFSADIGYQDNRIDNPRPQVTPLGEIPEVPDADINYAQTGTFTDEEQLFGVVRAEFDVSDSVTLWAAGGGRSGEENNLLANPSALADGSTTAYRFDNARKDRVLSADVGARADFETGAIGHRAVLSAAIIDLDSKNAYAFSDFFNPFASDLYNPTPIAVLPAPDFFVGGDMSDPLSTEKVTNKSVAFADTMAFFDDRLLLTAGVRYQNIFTRSFDYNTGAELSRYDDDAVTPAFGAVFKLSPNFSLYGNYAESLQPGAIAPASSGATPILNAGEVLDPFKGDQVEVGAKFDGGNFGATLALFSLSRQNAIVVDQIFEASGEQRNRGVELSVFGEPVEGVRLIGGLTYVKAELEETQDGVNEGNNVIGVPEVQANINGEWDLPFAPGFTLDGRVVYTGEQYVNETNTIELDSWARLDLGLRYKTEVSAVPLTFRARVDNVTDNGYWASSGGYPGANYLIQGAPRTFMITVSADL
jgi:iron complex outermembrane recepter protein